MSFVSLQSRPGECWRIYGLIWPVNPLAEIAPLLNGYIDWTMISQVCWIEAELTAELKRQLRRSFLQSSAGSAHRPRSENDRQSQRLARPKSFPPEPSFRILDQKIANRGDQGAFLCFPASLCIPSPPSVRGSPFFSACLGEKLTLVPALRAADQVAPILSRKEPRNIYMRERNLVS